MPTRAIKAIFYTRFHHEKGNRVLHQVPSGSIIPSTLPSALPAPLFPFSSITQYLIPTQQFCDRLLTFCVNHYRVIGYPVCIREGKYSRNEFIFNFALVIGENELDWVCYGEVVRKLGRLLRGLEEQGGFLSREEKGVWEDDNGGSAVSKDESATMGEIGVGSGSKVHALCEMVLEDLNNYAECMIPIDDSNTINLKLFPTRPPPPPVSAHQVPLLTISLSSLQAPISSDLTLNRILPYINGVNSISHIAQLADTDLSLTRRAVQHLLYYGCLVLLDIFSFGAIYAPTAEIGGFVVDADIKDECMRYIRVPKVRMSSNTRTMNLGSGTDKGRDDRSTTSSSTSQHSDTTSQTLKSSKFDSHISLQKAGEQDDEGEWIIDHETLITLYTSLRQGLTLKNWVLENLDLLKGIDIRRFITFGIIKGLLYRVHKYAIATSTNVPPAPPTSLETSAAGSLQNNARDTDTATIRPNIKTYHSSQQQSHTLSSHSTAAPQTTTTNTTPHHQPHPSISLHKPSIIAASGASLTPHLSHTPAAAAAKTEDSGLASLASDGEKDAAQAMLRFLDGMHCFDEICCELEVAEKVVERHVRGLGEGGGVIVHR